MKADRRLSILFVLVGIAALSMLAILVFADAWGPVWKDNSVNVSSGTYYSPDLIYDFGINWTNETNGASVTLNVSFETNLTTGGSLMNITQANTSLFSAFTNNTVGIYNISFTSGQLAGVGGYVYRWYANDTFGIGEWNFTDQWTYVITQNPDVNFTVWLNGTANSNRTIEWPSDINATCKINLTSQNTFEMYRNGTKVGTQSGQATEYNADLGEGGYNITCYYNETQNYTAVSTTYFLKVLTSPRWFSNSTKVASGSQYRPGLNFGFQINWTDLAGNLDNVTFETNLTTGSSLLNITKASTGVYQNFTNSSAGDIWWINFTQEQIAGAGTYVYRWYGYDVNDSWNNTGQLNFIIAKNTSKSINVSLFINGTENSALFNSSQLINITAALNVTNESVSIGTNFTGWESNQSGVNKTTVWQNLLIQNGSYQVVAYYSGDANYSVSKRMFYVNVSDDTAPQYTQYAQNTSTLIIGNTVNITAYWQDGSLGYAILATNESGSWQNKTMNYSSPLALTGTGMLASFTWNNTSIAAGGSVSWRMYANDSYGKENMTGSLTFAVKAANGASCSNDFECFGGYCCSNACQASSCTAATTTTSPSSSPSDTTTTSTTATTTSTTATTTTTLPLTEEMELLEF